MFMMSQPYLCIVEAADEPADHGVAVVGVLADGVGVVDDQAEAWAFAGHRVHWSIS